MQRAAGYARFEPKAESIDPRLYRLDYVRRRLIAISLLAWFDAWADAVRTIGEQAGELPMRNATTNRAELKGIAAALCVDVGHVEQAFKQDRLGIALGVVERHYADAQRQQRGGKRC